MKKVMSLVLALAMIASLFVVVLPTSVSAATAAKDPAIALSKSKCINSSAVTKSYKHSGFFGTANICNKDAAGKVFASLPDGVSGYANANAATALEITTFYPLFGASRYNAYSEKNAADSSSIFGNIIQIGLGSDTDCVPTPTKIKSIMLAIPAASSALSLCAPDGFTLYAGSSAWVNNGAEANKANYWYVATFTDLVKDGKYVESADKSYQYFECDLPAEVEASYLLLCFNADTDRETVAANKAAETAPSAYWFITEFAAYSESISGTPATGDTAVIFTVIAAVAALGMAVVITKKVTD